jgi:hypothetical protein
MVEHRQIICYNPHQDTTVLIDEKIAPLMKAIWDLGIQTENSCQENEPGLIWIEFFTSRDLEIFLRAAIPVRNIGFHESVLIQNSWKISAAVEDIAYRIIDDEIKHFNPPDYHVSLSLRFPIEDYEQVLANLLSAYKRKK